MDPNDGNESRYQRWYRRNKRRRVEENQVVTDESEGDGDSDNQNEGQHLSFKCCIVHYFLYWLSLIVCLHSEVRQSFAYILLFYCVYD